MKQKAETNKKSHKSSPVCVSFRVYLGSVPSREQGPPFGSTTKPVLCCPRRLSLVKRTQAPTRTPSVSLHLSPAHAPSRNCHGSFLVGVQNKLCSSGALQLRRAHFTEHGDQSLDVDRREGRGRGTSCQSVASLPLARASHCRRHSVARGARRDGRRPSRSVPCQCAPRCGLTPQRDCRYAS